MVDFVETTTNARGLQVVSPKPSYGFGTPQGSVCAYDVGSASIVQTEDETVCDILEVTGTLSSSKTVQMYLNSGKGNKNYKVNFSVSSSSGGPFTVTFSTGTANKQNVVVSVIASTDTLLSPKYMLFDLYVDGDGNVSSSGWKVSASNANGSYIVFDDGTMEEWGAVAVTLNTSYVGLGQFYYNSVAVPVMFPFPFIALPIVSVTPYFTAGAALGMGSCDTLTLSGFNPHIMGSSGTVGWVTPANWIAKGRWR